MSNVVWISSDSAWRRRAERLRSGRMSDPSFEARLERLFAQPPRLPDSEQFAARVEARLEREWSLRRGFIAVAGLAGGAVAVTQTVGSQLTARTGAVLQPIAADIEKG